MNVIDTSASVELEFDARELILGGTASYSGKPANFMVQYLRITYPTLHKDEGIMWRVYAVKMNKNGTQSAVGHQWVSMWHFGSEARARVEEIAKENDPR